MKSGIDGTEGRAIWVRVIAVEIERSFEVGYEGKPSSRLIPSSRAARFWVRILHYYGISLPAIRINVPLNWKVSGVLVVHDRNLKSSFQIVSAVAFAPKLAASQRFLQSSEVSAIRLDGSFLAHFPIR